MIVLNPNISLVFEIPTINTFLVDRLLRSIYSTQTFRWNRDKIGIVVLAQGISSESDHYTYDHTNHTLVKYVDRYEKVDINGEKLIPYAKIRHDTSKLQESSLFVQDCKSFRVSLLVDDDLVVTEKLMEMYVSGANLLYKERDTVGAVSYFRHKRIKDAQKKVLGDFPNTYDPNTDVITYHSYNEDLHHWLECGLGLMIKTEHLRDQFTDIHKMVGSGEDVGLLVEMAHKTGQGILCTYGASKYGNLDTPTGKDMSNRQKTNSNYNSSWLLKQEGTMLNYLNKKYGWKNSSYNLPESTIPEVLVTDVRWREGGTEFNITLSKEILNES